MMMLPLMSTRWGARLLFSAVVVLAVPAGAAPVWQLVIHAVAVRRQKAASPCRMFFIPICLSFKSVFYNGVRRVRDIKPGRGVLAALPL